MDTTLVVETTDERCRFYRSTCDIPAAIHPDYDRIVVRAGLVGAITMPADLGTRVHAAMTELHIPLGPVLAHSRSQRWTFLVRPDQSAEDMALFAELFRLNVAITPVGGDIALAGPTDDHTGYRHWVHPPTDSYRPTGATVVDLIRACLRKTLTHKETRPRT
ncbi:DNA-directed RNA polymerase subunit beta [Nocardia sp. NPDC052566]|uniref:DNA-directed RNA polymerase subunit beta n=1 Tax=Nocardia sp. NPDC052566 TaxID=3364330 RepID=UPI0037CA9905